MSAYERVLARFREVAALRAAQSLLSWDQQVLMPLGAASARAAHQQRLSRLTHERLTADEMVRDLADAMAETEPSSDEGRGLATLRRDLDVMTKLPADLVRRKAQAGADGYEAWKVAKASNDFRVLAPHLRELFAIARETSDRLGFVEHPYDPLLGLYEDEATYADAKAMFDAIKPPIVALVREIGERGRPVDDAFLQGAWDNERLREFAERAAAVVGFDFYHGRLNVAPNAFCANLGCADVRMTTRASDHVKGIVSSSLHEMGHGLYEQRSPPEWADTPLAGGVSLAVHESQSRFWENVVGRSRGFWRRFMPDLAATFPELGGVEADEMYRAINKVSPSCVRVGADELTYNLHILVRFELEVALITGALDVDQLPEAWNQKYREYLGITPPTDAEGCLQDVHWSRGSVGYFPTYAMGNLIGVQIWECLTAEIPDTDAQFAAGNFAPVLDWLTEKVYRQGCRYTPRELVTRITGRPMDPTPWLRYADAKYRSIYDL